MSSYCEFAQYYDRLMDNINYDNWFSYIESIFKKYDLNPDSILEMACGTGSLTKHLAEEGYLVTCFDISEQMLSIAYNKLRKYPNVKVLNQDMVNFNLNKKYDVILCLCDSINYITTTQDLGKVFNNVYNHLNDNGIFIFDINSYYKLKNIIGNNTFAEDKEEIYYVWENYFDDKQSICEFYLTFFIKQNEFYKRFDEKHIQRAYKLDEIKRVFETSSFSHIIEYEGFTFEPPHVNSERINFVVKK